MNILDGVVFLGVILFVYVLVFIGVALYDR